MNFISVNTESLHFCLAICASSLIWLATPAMAQDENTDKSKEIELAPIEVKGYYENRQKQYQTEDFFRSYTSDKIFSEKLERESISDVKQALKDLPNVQVIEEGAFIKRVRIRGLSGDRIQSLIDGVRLTSQGLTHAGGGELNLQDIANVDSIEVIKGSPSVIYAPGASGGVVNVKLRSVPNQDSLSGRYTFNYDDGLGKTKHSALLSGAWKGLGANLVYSRTHANDYKVKDKDKLAQTILRTNVLDERLGTEHEIKNLGFNDESWQARLQYQYNKHHRVYYAYGDYLGKDIAFTHGAATSQVFFLDTFGRKSHLAGYKLNKVGPIDQLDFTYSKQMITRGTFQGIRINETKLESDSFQLKAISRLGMGLNLTLGAEYTKDKADTQTLATQEYYAGFMNLEYLWKDWLFTAGLRHNAWTAKQRINDDRDANGRVGVSSNIGAINDSAFTYAFSMTYSATANQNLAFNYSRTHRFPSLFERFAFTNFIGGGADLESEKADNFDISWKYLNDPWFSKISLFYSKFDSFLGTELRNKLINPIGLASCIARGRCDPETGDYDDREEDFFSTTVHFANLGKVINRGFEVSTGIIVEGDYEAGVNVGLNDIVADNVFAQIGSNPLEVSAFYRKIFSTIPLKPWIQLKARYVTNWPKVRQFEGFNSFFTADAHLGARYEYTDKANIVLNFGIRNLTNTSYHEAFSALDGLKRTVFGNVSMQLRY